MTAGQHIRVDSQPFPRYPLLEGGREEAIVSAHRDPDRHVRPRREVADGPEGRLGLGKLLIRAGGKDLGRDVVQEVGGQVEIRAVAAFPGRGHTRLLGAGVAPPGAGRLARYRDHRVDQDEGANGNLLRDERRGETADRRGDQHHIVPAINGRDDQVGVLGQAGAGIGTRQLNGDRLVASGLEQRDNSVPVPGVPARTGNQDVRTHDTRMNSRRGGRCQRAASSGTTFPGHYAAHEATGVLVADIREFFAGR